MLFYFVHRGFTLLRSCRLLFWTRSMSRLSEDCPARGPPLGEKAEIKFDHFFKKMHQSRPLFVYFRSFLITISIIQIEKA